MNPCQEIARKRAKLREQMRAANARILARHLDPDMNIKDASDVNLFVNKMKADGWHADAIEAALNETRSDPKKVMETLNKVNTVYNEGIQNAKDASQDRQSFLKTAWTKVRESIERGINRALNTMPEGLNNSMHAFLTDHVASKYVYDLGVKDAKGNPITVGANDRSIYFAQVEQLAKNISKETGGFSRAQVDRALRLWGELRYRTRGNWSNLEPQLERLRSEVENNLRMGEQGGRLHTSYLKADADLLSRASKAKEFRDYADAYQKKLDAIQDALVEHGLIEKGREGYWHNIIAVSKYAEPWDALAEGLQTSISNMTKHKVYSDPMEYLVKGGVAGSQSFIDLAGSYSKNVANAMRMTRFTETIRLDSKRDSFHPDRFKIQETADSQVPVFVQGSPAEGWKPPETFDGKAYENLGNVNLKWSGIYVHPKIYDWMAANYRSIGKTGGFMAALERGNRVFKTAILSSGYGPFSFHGMSLSLKTALADYASGASKSPGSLVGAFFRLPSIYSEGMNLAATNHPIFLKLIEAGVTTHQYDALIEPILKQHFNVRGKRAVGGSTKPGAETLATLGDAFTKWTNWSHDQLFAKWYVGLKFGLGKRMVESTWFEKMAAEKGEQKAMETVAKILNDSLGGQNLEMMGRGKTTQRILQFSLLAPDWQESKYRRIFGSFASSNPDVRNQYRAALAAEFLTVALTQWVAQNVWDAVASSENPKHKPRTLEDVQRDMIEGHFATIYLGKNDVGQDVRLKFSGTVAEDFNPQFKTLNHFFEAIGLYGRDSKGRLLTAEKKPSVFNQYSPFTRYIRPLPDEVLTTIRNRASPMLRPISQSAFKPSKHPSQFDAAFLPLPIFIQQLAFGLRGGMGEEDEFIKAASSAAIAFAGMPVEVRNPPGGLSSQKKPTALPH